MIEKLKAKLKEKGLPEFLAGLFKVEKDEDVEKIINSYEGIKDSTDPKLESVTAKLLADQASAEADRRVTDAVKTHETKLKEKFEFVKKDKKSDTPPTPSDNPEINELKKSIADLTGLVTGMVQKTVREQAQTEFLRLAKEKGIPEAFAKKYPVDDLNKLNDTLVIAEKEYTDIKQQLINEQFGEGGLQLGVRGNAFNETEVKNFAQSKNKTDENKGGIVGKEL